MQHYRLVRLVAGLVLVGMLVFFSPCLQAAGSPALEIAAVSSTPGNSVTLPITFSSHDSAIASTAFSIDFDQLKLSFDASDTNGDNVPDAVAFTLPAGWVGTAAYNASDTDGEIDITIYDPSDPLGALPEGTIVAITFMVRSSAPAPSTASVAFSADPAATFGDTSGQEVAGTTRGGSVSIEESRETPLLAVGEGLSADRGTEVAVPIKFTAGITAIASTAFSIDFDESKLSFDASDTNGDNVPDAVAFTLPAGWVGTAAYDASDTDGEIDITIYDPSDPLGALPEGTIVAITFMVRSSAPAPSTASVAFSADPAATFGDTSGQEVAGTTTNGNITLGGSTSVSLLFYLPLVLR